MRCFLKSKTKCFKHCLSPAAGGSVDQSESCQVFVHVVDVQEVRDVLKSNPLMSSRRPRGTGCTSITCTGTALDFTLVSLTRPMRFVFVVSSSQMFVELKLDSLCLPSLKIHSAVTYEKALIDTSYIQYTHIHWLYLKHPAGLWETRLLDM